VRRKTLKWGETPWDKMTREELMREVQRSYAAVEGAHGVLDQLRFGTESNPFWSNEGVGGRAMSRLNAILDPIKAKYNEVYHSFFRYATPLLFDEPNKWVVCPECGTMLKGLVGKETSAMVGSKCGDNMPGAAKSCPGVMRWVEWSDMQPGRWKS
jgi:hypothetical protein